MKTATKIWASVVAVLTLVLQVPTIQSALAGLLAAHPNVSAFVGGVAAILALLHVPAPAAEQK